jgi:hypothetical protein
MTPGTVDVPAELGKQTVGRARPRIARIIAQIAQNRVPVAQQRALVLA